MNTSSGSSHLMFPMGSGAMQKQYAALNQNVSNPLLRGFGFGQTTGRGAGRQAAFETQLEGAQGPMADYIRQSRDFLPTVMPGMQAVGADIAGRARPAFDQLLQSIQQGQGLLGEATGATQGAMGQLQGLNPYVQQMLQSAFSPQAQQGVQGGQRALDYARQSAGQAFGADSRAGFNAAQQAAQGVFDPQASMGLHLAQQAAQQAFSPLQNQALYQQALSQGQGAAEQALAARGLGGGGAGVAANEGLARQLATDFAARQTGEQQQALQGLGGQQGLLAGLQQNAAQGLGSQFQGMLGGQQAATAGLGGAAGNLANLQQMLQQLQGGAVGQQAGLAGQQAGLAGQLANLGGMGAELGGMQLGALPQLQAALASQYAMPMAGMQDLMSMFTGAAQPGYGLLQATMPQVGQNQSAWGIL